MFFAVSLIAAIAGRAVLGGGTGAEEISVAESGKPVNSLSGPSETRNPPPLALEKLARTPPGSDGIDLFAPKSWYIPPPPPPAAKVIEPVKPAAPRLPFSYVGQMEDKDGLKVILMRDDEMVFAAPGATLDSNYRLDLVTSDQLVFVYIPLGEKQIIVTGGK